MTTVPPMRRSHSLYVRKNCPSRLAESPRATNTTEKPTTNQAAWIKTRRRAAPPMPSSSSTGTPLMYDRYHRPTANATRRLGLADTVIQPLSWY